MKFTSLVYAAASGSAGGLTYSRNSSGMYVRARAVPVNVNSAQQQVLRNAMSSLTTAWLTTVTALQRTGWATFAANVPWVDALGASHNLSAINWYVKMNSLRAQSGLTRIDAPPTIFELGTLTPPVPTIVAAGTTASIAYTNTDSWAGEVGGALLVYASRPQNATKNFFSGPYRYAGKVAGAGTPPTSPFVATLPWSIGPAGSKMFFRFVSVRADGRPSASFRVTANA